MAVRPFSRRRPRLRCRPAPGKSHRRRRHARPADSSIPHPRALLSPRQWFTIFDRLLLFTDTIESRLPKDLRNPTARNAYRTDKYIHRDLYRALFATIDAISPRAADWSGPLFMAVSPTDEIVDSAATKQFFDATQASRAQFYEQPDAGHVLPLDNGHPQLAQEIIRFILAPAAPPVSPR